MEGHPLTDPFGRYHDYLRISLTERCNLRCRYCMPEEGVPLSSSTHLLTTPELVRIARLFVRLGVSKIRLTGGEPLLRKDVEELAAELGRLPGLRTLALTTNGLLLPKKLTHLQAAGVNALNISLDTLRPERFEHITRRRGIEVVLSAIDRALDAGYDPVKVNCVVMRGSNDDELVDFVALTETRPIEARFIEYMPFAGNGWADEVFMPFAEMRARIESVYGALVPAEMGPNETARSFRVPGFRGGVGFITSMSDAFCDGCNRLRLTADGHLKVCLFGSSEVNLRDALRAGATDDELTSLVAAAVRRKKAAHAGMYQLVGADNRPMILIGG